MNIQHCGGCLNPWNHVHTPFKLKVAITIVVFAAIAAVTATLALLASLGVNLHALNVLSAITVYGAAGILAPALVTFVIGLAWLCTYLYQRNRNRELGDWGEWDTVEDNEGFNGEDIRRIEVESVQGANENRDRELGDWGEWDTVEDNEGFNGEDIRRIEVESVQGANENRVRLKTELWRPFQRTLLLSVEKLKEYFDSEAIKSAEPRTLFQVNVIALLYHWKNALLMNDNAAFIEPLQGYLNEYHQNLNFRGIIENLQNDWNLVKENPPVGDLIDELVLMAIQACVLENEVMGLENEDYLEGKKIEVDNALEKYNNECVLRRLYGSISNINNALLQSDNELVGIVGNLSNIRG